MGVCVVLCLCCSIPRRSTRLHQRRSSRSSWQQEEQQEQSQLHAPEDEQKANAGAEAAPAAEAGGGIEAAPTATPQHLPTAQVPVLLPPARTRRRRAQGSGLAGFQAASVYRYPAAAAAEHHGRRQQQQQVRGFGVAGRSACAASDSNQQQCITANAGKGSPSREGLC